MLVCWLELAQTLGLHCVGRQKRVHSAAGKMKALVGAGVLLGNGRNKPTRAVPLAAGIGATPRGGSRWVSRRH